MSVIGEKMNVKEELTKLIMESYDQGVADAKQEALAVLEQIVAAARADEREQIAQMIEDAPTLVEFAQNENGGCLMCGFTPKLAATAIRARGDHCADH